MLASIHTYTHLVTKTIVGGDEVNKTFETMLACLLSGFGDILSLAQRGEGKPDRRAADYFRSLLPQPVVEAIEYHRENEEFRSSLSEDSLAHVVNAARELISEAARRTNSINDQRQQNSPVLESIFNHLNQKHGQARYSAEWSEKDIQYPSDDAENSTSSYQHALEQWEGNASDAFFDASHSNSLLALLEACFAYVPSEDYPRDRCDVSMFHQSKAIAAIGCCLERWLRAKGVTDYKEALRSDNISCIHEKPFLLYSLDLSGVQSFIYTISNKGALKGLRVRSFYLSILMEHIADEILDACGLFRVNLIYSGGGRAHLLLPNDGICLACAEEIVKQTNGFLLKAFGASLFLASGYDEASAGELSSSKGSGRSFPDVFRTASAIISQRKLHRYGAFELMELNRRVEQHASDRECAICGRSGQLTPHGDNEMICEICSRLERFSNTVAQDDLLLSVEINEKPDAMPLPCGMWLSSIDAASEPRGDSDALVRIYGINSSTLGRSKTVYLHIGNQRACNPDGSTMTFDQLAGASQGVKRLGILRADVDNLGALFASGFAVSDAPSPHQFETLPRYMSLSAAMTAFFQREINRIIACANRSWLPNARLQTPRNVTIVYSGGDDVFLVGAWNEVLDAGLALQTAFRRYTGGSVTLSAGLGLFASHEPVGILADTTADLEEEAKLIADGQKDAIALFATGGHSPEDISFTFHWDALRSDVLDEKIPLLSRVFSRGSADDWEAGNAFLYQALSLLRDVRKDQIAIARLAYLLARHTPDTHAPEEVKKNYDQFSKSVYQWALEPEQNRALQASILLHVYAHRKERDKDV